MPKPKQTQQLYSKKRGQKKAPEEPTTANEFLQAGVDAEEAGEKWRAGDAAKSFRFFSRALDFYEGGLRKHPDSFDLAYNRARLQYDVAQQPRLVVHTSKSLVELLQVALESHRYAVNIDPDNADLLFNVGQVLTTLAEAVTEDRNANEEAHSQALKLLQESLEFFQRCLNVQEYQFNQDQEISAEQTEDYQTQDVSQQSASGDVDMDDTADTETTEEEAWATSIEAVTKDTLLDTIIAQMQTLTEICSLESSETDWPLAWVEEYYQNSLKDNLSAYSEATNRQKESTLTIAVFRCALAHAAFSSHRIDLSTYAYEVQDAFEALDLSDEAQGLCDKADATLAVATSAFLQLSSSPALANSIETLNKLLWNHASNALDCYNLAVKLIPVPSATGIIFNKPTNPSSPSSSASPDTNTAGKSTSSTHIPSLNLPQIHLRRGDIEVFRLSLRDNPTNYSFAEKSAPTLAGNAALYYRMAGRQASNVGQIAKEEAEDSYMRGLVVDLVLAMDEMTSGGVVVDHEAGTRLPNALQGASDSTIRTLRDTIEDMRGEGLLSDGRVEGLGRMFG